MHKNNETEIVGDIGPDPTYLQDFYLFYCNYIMSDNRGKQPTKGKAPASPRYNDMRTLCRGRCGGGDSVAVAPMI